MLLKLLKISHKIDTISAEISKKSAKVTKISPRISKILHINIQILSKYNQENQILSNNHLTIIDNRLGNFNAK